MHVSSGRWAGTQLDLENVVNGSEDEIVNGKYPFPADLVGKDNGTSTGTGLSLPELEELDEVLFGILYPTLELADI